MAARGCVIRGGLARLTSNDDVRNDGLVGKGARSGGRGAPFDGLGRDLSIATLPHLHTKHRPSAPSDFGTDSCVPPPVQTVKINTSTREPDVHCAVVLAVGYAVGIAVGPDDR